MVFGEGFYLCTTYFLGQQLFFFTNEKLSFYYIKASASENTFVEPADESICFYKLSSSSINEDTATFQEINILLIDKVMRTFYVGSMERYDVGLLKQGFQ